MLYSVRGEPVEPQNGPSTGSGRTVEGIRNNEKFLKIYKKLFGICHKISENHDNNLLHDYGGLRNSIAETHP